MYIFLFNIFRSCPDRLLGNILCYLYALKRIYVHIIKTIIINNILFDSILLLTLPNDKDSCKENKISKVLININKPVHTIKWSKREPIAVREAHYQEVRNRIFG